MDETNRRTSQLSSGFSGFSIVGAAGAAYSLGFVIMSIHNSRLGAPTIDFLRSQYVLAGCVWSFLICGSVAVILSAARVILTALGHAPNQSSKSVAASARFAAWATGIWLFTLIVGFLTDGSIAWWNWRGFSGFGVIFFNGITAGHLLLLVGSARNELAHEDPDEDQQRLSSNSLQRFVLKVLVNVCFLGLAMYLYALKVLPEISPAFGGGRARLVQLVLTEDGLTSLQAAGSFLSSSTVPVHLLFEDSTGYVVSRLPQHAQPDAAPKVRVARELVVGLIYLEQ